MYAAKPCSRSLGQSSAWRRSLLGARFVSGVAYAKAYGPGRWRKCKGVATIRFDNGSVHFAEIHWYEAHGIGRKEIKIKRLLPAIPT